MFNVSFLSLNVLSIMSQSPFYTIYDTHQGPLKTTLFKSYFSRSFSHIIFSRTNHHNTLIKNNLFSKIANSAIYLTNSGNDLNLDCFFKYNDGTYFQPGDIIKNQVVTPDQYVLDIHSDNFRPFFRKIEGLSICGDITISNCIFDGCYADSYSGGSIHIEQDCTVLIHGTIFNNSYTKRRFGGACVIVKTITDENADFNTERLQKLEIQYCCFQDCYGNDANYKLYGVAIFGAAQETILYYASTVNCPGIDNGRVQACGAQFDINSVNASFHSINATGGYSEYCGAIELRHASNYLVKFETISNMRCMFGVAFTDIDQGKTDFSYSNLINIELVSQQNQGEIVLNSSLIYVRLAITNNYEFKISNLCFINIIFDDMSVIVSRARIGSTYQPIKIVLEDCSYDCANDKVANTDGLSSDFLSIINCNNFEEVPTTNSYSLLNLGECKGNATPEPLIPPTDFFTINNLPTKYAIIKIGIFLFPLILP